MFLSRFRLLSLSFFAATATAFAADQPPGPQDSKNAVQASGKESAPKTAVPQKAAPAGGVVVFIDPATGKIRQPDASEIGGLVPAPGSVAPKAPEPTMIQGPGGAVGAMLGEDALTYMVVTAAPDGKLAMDCVTGDQAAAARVAAGPAPKVAGPTSKTAETSAPATRPQDTHDGKVPR